MVFGPPGVQSLIDPIAGISPVFLLDSLQGQFPVDVEVGFHKPKYSNSMSNAQGFSLYIMEKNKTDYVSLLADVVFEKTMHEEAAFLPGSEAFPCIDRFAELPHMHMIAQNMRLACQDCQYNDLGVTAGRIGVLRERTLSIERSDGSSELRPAFAQVAMFYLSDPAVENVQFSDVFDLLLFTTCRAFRKIILDDFFFTLFSKKSQTSF